MRHQCQQPPFESFCTSHTTIADPKDNFVQVILRRLLSEALLSLTEERYNLILLDMTLKSGLDSFIRIETSFPEIPVIVLVAPAHEAIALKAITAGAQDYLLEGEVDARLMARAIRCAVERHRLLTELEAERNTALRALDHLNCGVILIDQQSKILRINRSAQAILDQNDGLLLRQNTLKTNFSQKTASLRRFISEALRGKAGQPPCGGYISLTRRSFPKPLSVFITPLSLETLNCGRSKAAAALFIADPDRNIESIDNILSRSYRLTPAEARLTAIILQGITAGEAAKQLGVNIATIRSHLQNIFQKTGTTRQSDLVRLLLTGPPAS